VTLAVLSQAGGLLWDVGMQGAAHRDLCFGGPNGRTAYGTEVTERSLVQFRADRPGLARLPTDTASRLIEPGMVVDTTTSVSIFGRVLT
jgi:hypothetical protein